MNSTNTYTHGMGCKSKWYLATMAAGFILAGSFFFTSCDVLDPEEPIPAYIEIDHIDLSVNPVLEGTGSHKITDAWVYCDGDLVGVFELPCRFPILEEGYHDIMIKAGIKVNGIAGSRGYYPFYVPYEQRLEFKPGEAVVLNPTVTYYPGKVMYKEAFEDGGMSLEAYGSSDTSIVKTSDPADVFEGSYSGVMTINSTYDYYLVTTTDPYELPKNGTPVFMEMNYKAGTPFIVGLIANINGDNQKKEVMTFNANTEWNKVYVNLTGITSTNQGASNFKLYFEVYKDDSIPGARVLLDNIKLVYN